MLIVTSVILIGFGFMSRLPSYTSILIESLSPADPAILGGATAMISGTGQIATLAVAPVFSILSDSFGMSGAMLTFFLILIIPITVNTFLVETGKLT